MSLYDLPYMVMADARGRVFEHPLLRMAGRTGRSHRVPEQAELMPLPPGSDLYVLPGRHPVGMDPATGRMEVVRTFRRQPVSAVSAFLPPAHTAYLWAAFQRSGDAPVLPLYAYTALGWSPEGFVTPAVRIDPDPRQDLDNYPADGREDRLALKAVEDLPGNRLVKQLSHCCRVYRCPAARNLFLGRYEAPLPTSPGCNARCVGCISLQEDGCAPATQDRLDFVPTPEEIAEVALLHIQRAGSPVVSFGQGCEGEPLTNWKVLEKAIRLIRRQTPEGTVNLNTNASMPDAVARLFDAGLDSMRVSMNSARPRLYENYFRPVNYAFEDVVRSIEVARDMGRFVSLNYFVFPGVTDDEQEHGALRTLMESPGFDMIQWRNLNIDPDLYLDCLGTPEGKPLGVRNVMEGMREDYPELRHGYFNPAIR